MNNQDIIMSTLHEIRDDQKAIMSEVNKLAMAQVEIKTELAISRNGYTPHEIVELLHWAEKTKLHGEKQAENIRRAIISWIVPIICSATVVGLFLILRG